MSKVEWKKLREVALYLRGITYSKKDEQTDDIYDSYAVLRSNNITLQTNTLNFTDVKYVSKNVKVKKEQMLIKGDILICAGNGSLDHIGKVAYIPSNIEYTFGGFMGVIRCKDIKNSKYLFYILTSRYFSDFLKKNLNGAAINNLNSNILHEFIFPIPHIAIQQQTIVNQLDTFTSLIDKLERELELRQKQYEHYREELLNFEGDEEVKWKELGKFAHKETQRNKLRLDYPAYSITQGGLVPTRDFFKEKTNVTSKDTSTYFVVHKHWFVYSPSRIDVGSINYLRVEGPVIVSPIDVVFSINADECTPEYLYYFLTSHMGMKQIMNNREGVEGMGRKNLPFERFASIKVPIPSPDEQDRIVSQLDTFEQLIAALKREIALRRKQYEFYREKLLTFE